MSAFALSDRERIEMGLLIRGGPRQKVPLNRQSLDPALVFADVSQSARLQSYLELAEKLEAAEEWKQSHTVFLTSAEPGDGRTSTAFNLGWALASRLAEGAKPVLVAEFELERPAMRRMLGSPRLRYGIDCALRNIASEEESAFTLVNDRLHVSAVRDRMSRRKTQQLLSRAESFLEWAVKEHSWVVVDCPPVHSRRWTKWYREHAKDVLLLARADWTPQVRLRSAAKKLGSALRGVTMNRAAVLE
ncbi:tyrosine-protein kinase family protein [Silvibacterium dinghuense]|uniref:Tyrosine-protein kinase family protein n=1 Tax=Silvibacterium dinghuense TaxID=1560006 RepID=A0A4V1NV97_9BACT|nr:tyrosine-protein kinase family protein [Silvibacterium dinghuense]RXS95010.1 tyrosine-protein kinase family protein [Silvibacterium dinghuense]GGH09858.1 hypothetical protein GCM10011586_27930 [Silvibacterium dinghuense]